MSDAPAPELRQELLDDFYAEYDELLLALREGLTRLEGKERGAKILEGLFRTTHTLKGISAIVGLRSAEELAHAMEELLRALSKGATELTAGMVDDLLAAAHRLEQIGTAHRVRKPVPAVEDLLKALRATLPKAASDSAGVVPVTPAAAEAVAPVDVEADARARGLSLWRAAFSPSAALDARKINVTTVRERLQEVGEILRATPIVKGKGVIVFEFLIASKTGPAETDSWAADGIVLTPVEPPAVVERTAENASASSEIETSSLAPSHMVRVDLARLDDLMRITGEMVILRSRLEERLAQSGGLNPALKEVTLGFSRSLREMREAIARVRMVPIAEIFARMPFVMRDLVRDSKKKVRVVLEGNQTEVDKYLVERLKEPLLHLMRNAFAHGIESAKERESSGKPAEATVTLRAQSVGESVLIRIRDDGRGINAAQVRARALAAGMVVPDQLDAAALLKILCAPGFSTKDQADLAAGRGVGMAVVATTVRELGGLLTLESLPGQGTEFSLKLPLTLSIAAAIIVGVNGETCAVPQSAVDEILQVPATVVRAIGPTEVIPYREGLLPIVRLRRIFGAAPLVGATLTVLVVSSDRGSTGLVVDQVRSQREIVIRPLSDPLIRVPGIAGATELGDGRPILILDPNALTQGVVRPPNNADFTTQPLPQGSAL